MKGFTLIELLAVIVILTIILIISIPMISGIIEETKKSTFESNSKMIAKSAENEFLKNQLNGTVGTIKIVFEDGIMIEGNANFSGEKPKTGTIIVDSSGKVSYALYNGKYCALKLITDLNPVIDDKEESLCILPKDETFWYTTMGGNLSDQFSSVYEKNGQFLAVGTTNSNTDNLQDLGRGGVDFLIAVYDNDGNLGQVKTLGGTAAEQYFNSLGTATGVYLIGATSSVTTDIPGSGKGLRDSVIAKYDYEGTLLWIKSFGGSDDDYFYTIMEVSDGVIVAGYTKSTNGDLTGLPSWGNGDISIVKYSPTGTEMWKRTFGGTGADTVRSGLGNSDGSFALVGTSTSTNNGFTNKGAIDAFIATFNSSNAQQNIQSFGGNLDDSIGKIIATSDSYIVCGNSNSTTGDLSTIFKGNYDNIVLKYSKSNLTLAWKKTIGGTGSDQIQSMVEYNGGLYISGMSLSNDGDFLNHSYGDWDAYIAKIDNDGNTLWIKNYGGEGYDGTPILTSDLSGALYMSIATYSTTLDMENLSKGNQDILYMKLNSDGTPSYRKTFGGSGDEDFRIYQYNETTLLAGKTSSSDMDILVPNFGNNDALLIKVDDFGNFKN